MLKLPAALDNRFEGLDLDAPEIDFVSLAQSLGVEALRVETPDDLSAAVADSLRADQPRLITVAVCHPQA